MIRRLRSLVTDEGGFSLIELSVSLILSSLIAASFIAVFYSFSQNTGDLAAKSDVQADARSVIACWLITNTQVLQQCLPVRDNHARLLLRSLQATSARHKDVELDGWLDALNRRCRPSTRQVSLSTLEPHWRWRGGVFESTRKHVLEVRHLAVNCSTREVARWDQPILGTRVPGKLTTVMGLFDGVQHLLVQARLEAGNYEGFEITTTVQADSADDMSACENRYLDLCRSACTRLLRFENSEEGGRFDHCISEYDLYWADDPHRIEESPLHRWVSLAQLARWIGEPNRLTNELRSTISAILSLRG
jgi:oxidase EvaA